MFSLIITIISIALVAALALATIYYGGDAFEDGGAAAQAAQLGNEAQQISGALTLFRADKGRSPTSLLELAENKEYLSSVPSENWVTASQFVVTPESKPVSDAACLQFNESRGVALVPQCDDPAYQQVTVCCSAD